MARRRRRKSGSSAGPIIASVILGIFSVAILGGFVYLKIIAKNPEIDKASLCPVDGPREITAILVDVTDPISKATATDLRNEFEAAVSAVAVGGLIQVYTLTEAEGELTRTFSKCNPGGGESVDEWTSNPDLAQKRWEEGFQRPLDEIAKRMDKGVAGKQSPIMAGIQSINLEVFGAPQNRDIPKQLIVASDMIEHTAAFSMYRDGVEYARFERSPARDQFRTSLDGIAFRVLGFQRPGLNFDTEQLADFWKTWVVNNRGETYRFTRLEGIR